MLWLFFFSITGNYRARRTLRPRAPCRRRHRPVHRLLRRVDEPSELPQGPAARGQQGRRERRHQLDGHELHHAARCRLPRRRLPRQILDHRALTGHLLRGTYVRRRPPSDAESQSKLTHPASSPFSCFVSSTYVLRPTWCSR